MNDKVVYVVVRTSDNGFMIVGVSKNSKPVRAGAAVFDNVEMAEKAIIKAASKELL